MEIDETTLRVLAAKSGLPSQFAFKEAKLFEALSKILQRNKEYKLDIVMKGGTALNKAYLQNIQRFSEDVDFDLFSKTENLEKIVSIEGFELQGPWRFRNTLRYHLSYLFLGKKDNIRVEFSVNKLRKTLHPVALETMVSGVTGSTLYGVPMYTLDDIVARKMNALRSRTKGKDIWDCYQAVPRTQQLKKAMEPALRSEKLNLSVSDALQQTIDRLKKLDAKEIMKSTNPYIPMSLRPRDWKGLIADLIQQLETLP